MYENFVKLCEKKGVSTYKVCKDLGISQGTISNWKNRGTNLNSTTMKKIADYFDVTVDELLGSKDIDWNPKEQVIERKELIDKDFYIKNSQDILMSTLNRLQEETKKLERLERDIAITSRNIKKLDEETKNMLEIMENDESFKDSILSYAKYLLSDYITIKEKKGGSNNEV